MPNVNTYQESLDWAAYCALDKAMRELRQRFTISEQEPEWEERRVITKRYLYVQTTTEPVTKHCTLWAGKLLSGTTE